MNRNKLGVNYFFFFLSLISILFLIFPTTKFVSSFKLIFSYILSPELTFISNSDTKLKSIPENILNLIKIDYKNREYEEKIKRLKIEVYRLESLLYENKKVSEFLSITPSIKYKGIFARVISKDPVNPYNTIFIDKGNESYIKDGYPVIGFEDGKYSLIGRVFEVYKNYSRVMLITDMRISFVGFVQERNVDFLLKGANDKKIIVDYISNDFNVKIGDIIKTSPSSLTFPPYLPVAFISDIYKEKSTMNFYSAIAFPIVDIRNIRNVFVMEYEPKIKIDRDER